STATELTSDVSEYVTADAGEIADTLLDSVSQPDNAIHDLLDGATTSATGLGADLGTSASPIVESLGEALGDDSDSAADRTGALSQLLSGSNDGGEGAGTSLSLDIEAAAGANDIGIHAGTDLGDLTPEINTNLPVPEAAGGGGATGDLLFSDG